MTPTPPDISLAPEDWYWATWRRLPPLPRPAPRPFDRAACLSALAEQFDEAGSHYLPMDWKPIFTEKRITPDEASFWMESIRLRRARQRHDAILAELESYTPNPEETQRWFRTLLDNPLIDLFFWPLMGLLPPADVIQIVLDDEQRIHTSQCGTTGEMKAKRFYRRSFMRHFRSMVLPYLSDEERAGLCALVRPATERARWPTAGEDACASFYLAAALGMQDVIHQILKHTKPERHCKHGLDLAEIIFGLDSADAVREHIDHYELHPTTPQHVRAWIAHTELESLAWVAQPRWAGELSQIRAPAIAPHMLRFLQADLPPTINRSWLYPIARDWLYANAEIAVAGLLALPRHDPIWPLAERWLRQKELAPLLARHPRTKRWPNSALITPGRTPAWLAEPTQALESDETPHSQWVDATMLPPISYRKKLLTHDQLNAMLDALRNCNGFDYVPLADDLSRHIPKDQRDALGRFLFTYWLEEQPIGDMWILYVLGLFGTDTAVRLLTSMLQTWEDCDDDLFTTDAINGLGMIASDAALRALDTVTQDIRLFSLHSSAHANIAGIADYRNISFNRLLLHLAPTYGMDGSITFGIDGQRLTPALDADLHPILCDNGGRTYRDLPSPPEGTPADEAEREATRWQQHRRAMRTAVRQQAYRLQQHMINQHHWSAREMRSGVLRHPLLGPLARRLLWAGYRAKDCSYQALLFSDDQSVVDEHYRTVDIGDFRSFTLVHPVLASTEQRRRWVELLNDFAIIPFFPQASRPVFTLSTVEHTAQTISIAPDTIFTDDDLESLLRPRRWASFRHTQNRQRYYARYFSEADITAVLFAYPLHDHYHNTEYRISHLLFIEDHVHNYYMANRLLPMHLSEVDPIIISEVLWELSVLDGP